MTSLRLAPFDHATGGANMGKRGTAECHTTFKPGPCFKRRTSSDNLSMSFLSAQFIIRTAQVLSKGIIPHISNSLRS